MVSRSTTASPWPAGMIEQYSVETSINNRPSGSVISIARSDDRFRGDVPYCFAGLNTNLRTRLHRRDSFFDPMPIWVSSPTPD